MHSKQRGRFGLVLLLSLSVVAAVAVSAFGADWAHWRGPFQNGVSPETNLPDKWSATPGAADSNLVWKVPIGGRSTPLVLRGRLFLINKTGEGVNEQERVLCCDAATGQLLWEYKFNVFHTDIVSARLGWTNLAADPQTGNLYAHGTQGFLLCLNRDGKLLWQRSLTEEFGRISGYGGRLASPVVDGDLVLLGMLNASWGEHARGGSRFVAFDKNTGDVVWWASTGFQPKDTYYSNPVVADINGTRLLISGGGDGGVHAFKVRTGEKVWSYLIGAGAVNCSPVVEGTRVYIGHGEENLDNNQQGKVVCLDAADVVDGKPKLVWQVDGIKVKYCSPILHAGRLYVCEDVPARMFCLDAATGKQLWRFNYGRNAKGSPVWADGKIYVTDVNGRFVILQPQENKCVRLHQQTFRGKDGLDVELNGSPAVANGRIYFCTSDELYCLGKPDAQAAPEPTVSTVPPTVGEPAALQVVPAEVCLQPGESVQFKARLFDARGNFVKETAAAWSVAPPLPPEPAVGLPPVPKAPTAPPALKGQITPDGKLTVDASLNGQFGTVVATVNGLPGRARVRVAPRLPLLQDFENVPVDRVPGGWVNAQGKFAVRQLNGGKGLVKLNTNPNPLVARANAYLGKPTLSNYTIQADVQGTQKGTDLPDMGVVANRYTLLLAGNTQQLRLISWDALPRVDRTLAYPWQAGVWYRLKLTVEPQGDKVLARGKVWPRDQEEPKAWTVEFLDPVPNREGAPALYGYITGFVGDQPGNEIYYDNVRVTPNDN